MAFGNGPRIVTSGLVLSLDAADRNSYPSTGTTWFDLSGQGNNGTLTNGPTFNSANGGAIVFDGVDDYVNVPYNTVLNTPNGATYELWIYRSNGGTFLARGTSDSGATPDNPRLYVYPGTGQVYYDWSSVGVDKYGYSTANIDANTWNQITLTATPGSYMALYINGVDRTGSPFGGTLANPLPNTSDPLIIGGSSWAGVFTGRIASTKLYNRALSATEVLQNYNALKSRFNL